MRIRIQQHPPPLPFDVNPDLFDYSRPDSLGLVPVPGAETVTIFHPGQISERNRAGGCITCGR